MPTRHEVVRRILELRSSDLDPDEAERTWFCDVRRRGGWRLTLAGRAAFDLAGIQHWTVPLEPVKLDRRLVLDMNHRIQWPYFISSRPPELWLFSDRDAVMVSLYGDISAWIHSLSKQALTNSDSLSK
jgi:hypothetical protein